MSEPRIYRTLLDFAERGFGGAFVHPRPGLITEYLSEEWFELWRFAQRTAGELGLALHVYDENSYPSGFAGGYVLEVRPDLALKRLVPDPTTGVRLEATEPNGWYAGKTYVDVLHPDSARVFTDITHARYAREIDTAGLYCFTDEPSVMDYSAGSLPWSPHIQQAFQADHGYDLEPLLFQLFSPGVGLETLRYHYQETLQRLFGAFLEGLREGYHRAGMKLCGHLHEHEWPCPRYNANSMEAYTHFDVPGIDLLGFQFKPDDREGAGIWLLTVLEAASVAAQLGKDTVMCEAFGGGGYECGPRYFKRAGDFLLAYGVNLIVPHMCYQTMAGARKYDWPQTISDHAPFWDDLAPLNRHQTAVATFLAEGESMATSWCCSRRLLAGSTGRRIRPSRVEKPSSLP